MFSHVQRVHNVDFLEISHVQEGSMSCSLFICDVAGKGIKSSTPEEFFAFTLYYYNGCVYYLFFFFFYLSGDMWPWLDLYQLKIKPVIGLTKPAWRTRSIRNLDDPVKFHPWRLFFFMNQPITKRTETLNPPHPNFQLEMKTKHVSIFYLLCMIRPWKLKSLLCL